MAKEVIIRQSTVDYNVAVQAIKEVILRKELPGLKGFSESNLKNMRMFYEEWAPVLGVIGFYIIYFANHDWRNRNNITAFI